MTTSGYFQQVMKVFVSPLWGNIFALCTTVSYFRMELGDKFRVVKPFLCSAESSNDAVQHVMHDVVPRLHLVCSNRGGSFTPYDWDLGLPEDRLYDGLALKLALDCVQLASPFFICIIGDNYGSYRPEDDADVQTDTSKLENHWIDLNITTAVDSGYTWLLDESYRHTSLFEMKIIQATVMNNDSQFCRFYMKESAKSGDSNVSSFEKFKLQQLKAGLANKGLHVTYFRDTNSLKEALLKDWEAIIDQLFPKFDTLCISQYTVFYCIRLIDTWFYL